MFKENFFRGRASRKTSEVRGSRGWIDTYSNWIVEGWFIDRTPGVRDNRFCLAIDDLELGEHYAALPRSDVQAVEGVLHCGFRIDLKQLPAAQGEMLRRYSDGAAHRIAFRDLTGRLIADKEVILSVPIKGRLERCDARGMSGWAVNESRPDEGVDLDVYLDGAFYYGLTTSQRRGDVINAGHAGERAGFRIDWPLGLLPNDCVIEVKIRQTGQALPAGSKTLSDMPTPLLARQSIFLDPLEFPAVTVVIPVFNARDAVEECLASVRQHLPVWASVLVIDDASSDAAIPELLEGLRDPRFEVLTNRANLGYTKTINLGIRHAAEHDVVLLNSDTVVHRGWLEALRYAAYATGRVATVTALSNHAGAFSAPEIGEPNARPPHIGDNAFVWACTEAGEGRFLEVPTGSGFCMYVRRAALQSLGLFDEIKYPRGYGEENDFCMRALRHGWRNLVCDKAYVLHKRSQSFGQEKDALIAQGARQLANDYPEYKQLTSRFRDAEFAYVRHRVRQALAKAASNPRARVLYVIASKTGGTPQTNMDLMLAMAHNIDCWLLHCDGRTITLYQLVDGRLATRETRRLVQPIEPITHRSGEYDSYIVDILYRRSIQLLHVRHIAWHSLGLAGAARSLGIPVIFSIHDFYSVCLSHNLLDDQSRFCGGTCTPGDGNCPTEIWPAGTVHALKHRFVHRWRAMFSDFAMHCDRFITTSPSAAALFERCYPELGARLAVIPHGRDFDEMASLSPRIDSQRLRVLVPGNIGLSKGAAVIRSMIELGGDEGPEFHFLGATWDGLRGLGVHHGKYERSEFVRKVREISPHVGVVLSLWPETYCHTLTEMWACGIPVVAFDVGAVGDRVRASGGGWLLSPDSSPAQILSTLRGIGSDAADLDRRREAVGAWQRTEGVENTTARMAAAYREVYRTVLSPAGTGRADV